MKKKPLSRFLLCLTGIASLFPGNGNAAEKLQQSYLGKNAHNFSFVKIDGGPLKLSEYAGKLVMIVNTASRCGYTRQYAGLENLYDTYKDKGFVIVGVPSNDFLWQEPGSNEEIKKFCETNFNIKFPLVQKVHVKGDDAHPFYQWAAGQTNGGKPGWNFYKFLISPQGKVIKLFPASTEPDDADLKQTIESNLPH